MYEHRLNHEPWPLRAPLLLGLGVLFGLAVNALVTDGGMAGGPTTNDALRLSLGAALAMGGVLFAFTVERVRWRWSIGFAVIGGIVAGLILYWNGDPTGWSANEGWRYVSCLLALAIAAPLFQAARDEGRLTLSYPDVLGHAWNNVILWFAAWAFVAITFLMVLLLGALFDLIGIDLIERLMRKSWFMWALIGGALGAGVGLLRDRDQVLGLLQRVVLTVLSFLAPVLAVGLVLFVMMLPVTGLSALSDQTDASTPILLMAAIGAIILVNAVVGTDPDDEPASRVLNLSGMALAVVATPLALVALVSTSLRIDQHGLSPERLWALTFILIIAAIALGYLYAVVRRRTAYARALRPINIRLAQAICGVALILATPLPGFGAIATADQVRRLQSGAISPERFDWGALRFDFGPSGRKAVEELALSSNPAIRSQAIRALNLRDRYQIAEAQQAAERQARFNRPIRVLPAAVPLPADLRDAIAGGGTCTLGPCTAIWSPGEARALVVGFACERCSPTVSVLVRQASGWAPADIDSGVVASASPPDPAAQRAAVEAGQIEVRTVPRRQVYVGGRPVGPMID